MYVVMNDNMLISRLKWRINGLIKVLMIQLFFNYIVGQTYNYMFNSVLVPFVLSAG